MRIAILDTYYSKFLLAHYAQNRGLKDSPSSEQRDSLLAASFGTSDYYSSQLNAMGCESIDLIANCAPLQAKWASENNIKFSEWVHKLPRRVIRLPVIGGKLDQLPGLVDVVVAQIKSFTPDVLYCQDLSFLPNEVLKKLKNDVKLVVGQIACPLPVDEILKNYDLILTSFPHYVSRFREKGIASEYFKIGFDPRVLSLLKGVDRDVGVSFVGGLSPHHKNALQLLEYLASNTPIKFFGYGAESLPRSSRIKMRHQGEVWGKEMYRALARSQITINRHIDVAENNANNMRLFEATGVGSLLITDKKDNLHELFEIGREVVSYSSKEEAAELINHYLSNPEEAEKIARAGQARTLREHTYQKRMEELVPILKHYLDMK